jgi:hypothetical protein
MNQEALDGIKPILDQIENQEDRQALIDAHVQTIQNMIENPEFQQGVFEQVLNQRAEKMISEVVKSDDVGGDDMDKALADAKAGVEAFGDKNLSAIIFDEALGIGNNIHAVRFFKHIGEKAKELGFLGDSQGGEEDLTEAQRFYKGTDLK